jgi:putative two-component system protein, hydrogenase maturation factor HypX/HoxX
MRSASKASLYRREVARAAVRAMLDTVTLFESRTFMPEPLDYSDRSDRGILRPSMKQHKRAIDW